MKLKNLLMAAIAVMGLAMPMQAFGQAEVIENKCKEYFEYPYILTGKPFKSLLTGDEVAEFKATLFSSTTYRIAVGSKDNNNVIFSVYDTDHNLLFSNEEYNNAPYWDFPVDGYLDCIIEARLDKSRVQSGFAIVMTGIKLNE